MTDKENLKIDSETVQIEKEQSISQLSDLDESKEDESKEDEFEEVINQLSKKLIFFGWFIFVLLLVSLLIPTDISNLLGVKIISFKWTIEQLAQLGDSFGGIFGTVLSLAIFYMLIQELRLTRDSVFSQELALKNQVESLRNQNNAFQVTLNTEAFMRQLEEVSIFFNNIELEIHDYPEDVIDEKDTRQKKLISGHALTEHFTAIVCALKEQNSIIENHINKSSSKIFSGPHALEWIYDVVSQNSLSKLKPEEYASSQWLITKYDTTKAGNLIGQIYMLYSWFDEDRQKGDSSQLSKHVEKALKIRFGLSINTFKEIKKELELQKTDEMTPEQELLKVLKKFEEELNCLYEQLGKES
jgi:hypothetical protein